VHGQRVLQVPDEIPISELGLDPTKLLVVVAKKAAPVSLTLRFGDMEISATVPPQRSIMSELLMRGLVTSDVIVVHRGHMINPQAPVSHVGIQSGDTVFVHRKETGHGAKAAGDVLDTFTRNFQLQKEEERRELTRAAERQRQRNERFQRHRIQQARYMTWKMLSLSTHPVRQQILLFRRIRHLVLSLRNTVQDGRTALRPRGLPEDVLACCLGMLDLADIRQALKVCTGWFCLLTNERLWAAIYVRDTGLLSVPVNGPRLLLESLYQQEQDLHGDAQRPIVFDVWEEPNPYKEKSKRGPRFTAPLPDPGILSMNFGVQCVDEATAYMTLSELHWARLHRDQAEFRALFVTKLPQQDSFEWRPMRAMDQSTKVVQYLRKLAADAVGDPVAEDNIEAEELSRIGRQTICKVVGAAAITALGAVYADGLDGIAAACPERVNGKGLLDFSDVTIIAAFEELNRYPFAEADAADDVAVATSSLAANSTAPLEPRNVLAASERDDWHASVRGRLLDAIEDQAFGCGCTLVTLQVSEGEPNLATQCQSIGYQLWSHTSTQHWQRVPGFSNSLSNCLAPHLHTKLHFLLDCELYVKAL
jgi:hypothetical protein